MASAPPALPGPAGGGDAELLAALQQRLKPQGGGRDVKIELIAAALDLARNPALVPSEAYKAHGVPAGGARTRVLTYRNRILDEELTN